MTKYRWNNYNGNKDENELAMWFCSFNFVFVAIEMEERKNSWHIRIHRSYQTDNSRYLPKLDFITVYLAYDRLRSRRSQKIKPIDKIAFSSFFLLHFGICNKIFTAFAAYGQHNSGTTVLYNNSHTRKQKQKSYHFYVSWNFADFCLLSITKLRDQIHFSFEIFINLVFCYIGSAAFLLYAAEPNYMY